MTKEHPADKYNIQVNAAIGELKASSETRGNKKVELTYKKIKNNMCFVQKYEVLPATNLTDAHGNSLNAAEEPLFKVMMVGKITDDYVMKVEPGDIILVTHFVGHSHLPTTEAKTDDGQDLDYYLVVALNDIGAVVEYKKIDHGKQTSLIL